MFDRIQIVPALWARWRSVVLVWIAIVAAVAVVTLVLPPRYEATAALVVEMNSADPMPGRQVFRSAANVSSYLATQAEVIKSESVALAALRRLELHKDASLMEQWREDTDGRGEFEPWLATKLLRNLAVTPSRDANVMTVSFTSGTRSSPLPWRTRSSSRTSIRPCRGAPGRHASSYVLPGAGGVAQADARRGQGAPFCIRAEARTDRRRCPPGEPDVESVRLAEQPLRSW